MSAVLKLTDDPDRLPEPTPESREDRAARRFNERDDDPPEMEEWDMYSQPDRLFR